MESLTGSMRNGALKNMLGNAGQSLARALRPRRPAVLNPALRGLHRDPGRPALGVQHRAARRVAPHRARRPRRRRSRRARTRSATSSRCAWSASLLDAGLPMPRIQRAVAELLRTGDDITGLRLVTDGDSVWACHDDGQILDALRHGQLALFVAVDRFADEVEAEVRDVRRRPRRVRRRVAGRDGHPSRGG